MSLEDIGRGYIESVEKALKDSVKKGPLKLASLEVEYKDYMAGVTLRDKIKEERESIRQLLEALKENHLAVDEGSHRACLVCETIDEALVQLKEANKP